LLDEATAALDGVTAKAIRTTIESLRGQVTVLIIAHQAETIANADRVAFLEHGLHLRARHPPGAVRQQPALRRLLVRPRAGTAVAAWLNR
jgi:ABC-type multidrug transport system fused ATPase/permease subunit